MTQAAFSLFSRCFCRWHKPTSSPPTPRVSPGRDYASIPADDDGADGAAAAAWSLLVGVVSKFDDDSSLRLQRLRVARSWRVLGRSNDALEVLAEDVVDCTPSNTWPSIRAAAATRGPGGRSLSLSLFSRDFHLADFDKFEPPRSSPCPRCLAYRWAPTCRPSPITAGGELWAPYLTKIHGPSRLVMLRLDRDDDAGAGGRRRWVEVADLHLPHGRKGAYRSSSSQNPNPVFQGYAVVGHVILLSLYPCDIFFTFDCSTLTWAEVTTDEARRARYIPVQRRAVYVEEDDTIYSACAGHVYAYKLCARIMVSTSSTGWRRLPWFIVFALSYETKELGSSRIWVAGSCATFGWDVALHTTRRSSTGNCDAKHVLITTFRVTGDEREQKHFSGRCFIPDGIEVLHSTCRRLDLWPSKRNGSCSYFDFSILQESMKSSIMTTQQHLPKRLDRMGKFIGTPFRHAVMLEHSPIRISKTLYIVCQVASSAVVFETNILDGKFACQGKTLTPHCTVDLEPFIWDMDRPLPSQYVCVGKSIYVVSSKGDDICECSLDTMTPHHFPTRPVGNICLICKVGNNIVAITDTLQCVYSMSSKHGWLRHEASGIPGLERKVNLSGYVVLSDESFMVSDVDSSQCYLLDMRDNKWRSVMPYALQDRTEQQPNDWLEMAFLSERSVFVKGFIYTCSGGGLTAYELIEEGNSYYLGDGIDLKFPWSKSWEHERMCLDCIGEHTSSGAILFCVIPVNVIVQRATLLCVSLLSR
ncbi:unnamed protein product [Urochloa decumbens]|uniref:Uncharacterized protein n=1 Tax=Urochloa decumbens TaxID=240449 RepID=A0ABC9E649_9POAL